MSRNFIIARAAAADADRLCALAAAAYFPEEPLNVACAKASGRLHYPDDIDLQYLVDLLPAGLSLMALHEDNVIGMALIRVVDTDSRAASARRMEKSSDLTEDEKLAYNFFHHMDSESGFAEEGDPVQALEVHVLAVAPAWRHQGVARVLMLEAERVAAEQGFTLMRADTTGRYSAALIRSLGYRQVHSLRYEDYRDGKGRAILVPPHPHTEYTVFKKYL